MAYAYSRARKSFHVSINDLISTSREADTAACSSMRARNLAHASAVILASTKVELYLEDLLLDWGLALANVGTQAGSLPYETRAYLLSGGAAKSAHRKLLLLDHGERQFLEIIARELRVAGEYRYARDGTIIIAQNIGSLLKDVKYPSEQNLKKLFYRCGISNIFASMNSIARRDVLSLHQSFSDLRTQIAHVGLPVGINGRDARERIKDISAVVGYLDRAFYRHNQRLFGIATWTL
jgi:hypothetical protein